MSRFQMTAADLKTTLKRMRPAICDDLTRMHLATLRFDERGLVATDGHKLFHLEHDDLRADPTPMSISAQFVDALLVALKNAEHADLMVNGALKVDLTNWGESIMVAACAPMYTDESDVGKYPDWRQVVPTIDGRDRLVLNIAQTLRELRKRRSHFGGPARAAVLRWGKDLARDEYAVNQIWTNCDDEIALKRGAEADSVITLRDDVESTYSIGVNPRYLMDALEFMRMADLETCEIWVKSGDELGPLLFRNGPATAIVMPMRYC